MLSRVLCVLWRVARLVPQPVVIRTWRKVKDTLGRKNYMRKSQELVFRIQ